MEAVIPTRYLTTTLKHSEADPNATTESMTQKCTEYGFVCPTNSNTSVTFIDTPGLADTRGLSQDDVNMNLILEAAADAQLSGTLSGIILVMKGNENRLSASVDTICTILKGSLPDRLLDNLIVAFSNCRSQMHCMARPLIPFNLSDDRAFHFDNPAFFVNIATLGTPEKKKYKDDIAQSWDMTMEEIGDIVNMVFKGRAIPPGSELTELRDQRMKIKAYLHDVKLQIMSLQQALDQMETAQSSFKTAKSTAESSKGFKTQENIEEKVLVDDPSSHHSTICSNCSHICHQNCGLAEIATAGDNAFLGCAAFRGSDSCRYCPEKCSFSHHYHGKKKLITRTTTVEKILEDMQRTHQAAIAKVLGAERKITTFADMEKAVEVAIREKVNDLQRACQTIRKICSGFNIANELNLSLEQLKKEQRKLHNTGAIEAHKKILKSVEAVVNGLASSRPHPPLKKVQG